MQFVLVGGVGVYGIDVNYHDENETEWKNMDIILKDMCGFRFCRYRLHVTQMAQNEMGRYYRPYIMRKKERLEEQVKQQQLKLLSQKQALKKLKKLLKQQPQQKQ
ncbi:hypothetical protein BV898_19710 [Hypsibius exemplaris]|uniref:Uncharacterized protein n=1 Tax=Hypsibius exemplaris TaxID=2072580 RepID=A0A9X6RQ12_HYPEX|nr:hypothetical protein BV898_19710 [Hypsibius exemplaris]